MTPLVWLAEVPFDGPPHRQQHLSRLLAARDAFDALYVEPAPPSRAPRTAARRVGGVRVAQIAPLLNAHPLFKLLAWKPMRRLAALAAAQQLRIASGSWPHSPSPRPVVISSNVFLAPAVGALRPRVLILDICDDPRHYPGEPPWTAELLSRAVRTADVVTTSSRLLHAEFEQLGTRQEVVYLSNGIHRTFLDAGSRARSQRPRNVLGFVGHIGPWIDLGLLDQLARSLPESRLELVGSVAPEMAARVQQLTHRPNVRYRPSVPYAAVPDVLAEFSVGLIPFQVSDYTRAVNPVKLYEYAAFDLPIVTTAFSQDVIELGESIDVCGSPNAFIAAAQARGRAEGLRSTRPIAAAHTWETLADRLATLIERALERD